WGSDLAMSTHTTQNGHGGFHGQPVTSLPHSAVAGGGGSPRGRISSPSWVGPRGLVRSLGPAPLTGGAYRRAGGPAWASGASGRPGQAGGGGGAARGGGGGG